MSSRSSVSIGQDLTSGKQLVGQENKFFVVGELDGESEKNMT